LLGNSCSFFTKQGAAPILSVCIIDEVGDLLKGSEKGFPHFRCLTGFTDDRGAK
jgi:hypothetical protein